MCGAKSSRFLLVLALLLSGCWPLPADYVITEAELTALESILTRQEATIETLQSELKLSESIESQLLSTLKQSDETIEKLERSLHQSGKEAKLRTLRTGIISATVGIVIGFVTGQAITTF